MPARFKNRWPATLAADLPTPTELSAVGELERYINQTTFGMRQCVLPFAPASDPIRPPATVDVERWQGGPEIVGYGEAIEHWDSDRDPPTWNLSDWDHTTRIVPSHADDVFRLVTTQGTIFRRVTIESEGVGWRIHPAFTYRASFLHCSFLGIRNSEGELSGQMVAGAYNLSDNNAAEVTLKDCYAEDVADFVVIYGNQALNYRLYRCDVHRSRNLARLVGGGNLGIRDCTTNGIEKGLVVEGAGLFIQPSWIDGLTMDYTGGTEPPIVVDATAVPSAANYVISVDNVKVNGLDQASPFALYRGGHQNFGSRITVGTSVATFANAAHTPTYTG